VPISLSDALWCLWPPPSTGSDLKHPPSDLIFSPHLNTFRPLDHTVELRCFVPPDDLKQHHPPDEKLVRKPASSRCPTEMSDLVSSETCRTSWSIIIEPPRRLSSMVPMPMTAKFVKFPTRTGSKFRAVYDRNCVRNRVTW
jgi:hypothetical protein